MDRGTLVGFDGRKVRHHPEEPAGLPFGTRRRRNYNELLPTEALHKGFSLVAIDIEEQSDPFVLYDRWGKILYQWPEDYVPRIAEVFEITQRFL